MHLQEGCKEMGNLLAIPLNNIEVKINIQQATVIFL
jgi:hypothetical protein